MYSVVKGSCEGLGVSTLLRDLGEDEIRVRMHLGAAAARGIVERKGVSKVRHVETDILCMQEQQARRLLPLNKLLSTENRSDLMTKDLSSTVICGYLKREAHGSSICRREIKHCTRTAQHA